MERFMNWLETEKSDIICAVVIVLAAIYMLAQIVRYFL